MFLTDIMATDSNLQILLDETGNQLATRLRDTGSAKKKLEQKKKLKKTK